MASVDGIVKIKPKVKITVRVISRIQEDPALEVVALPNKRNWHPIILGGSFMLIIISFLAGAFTVWNTHSTQADQVASPGGLVAKMDFKQTDLNVIADFGSLISSNRHVPTPAEIESQQRREKLKNYLASKNSPLAGDEEALDALLSSNNLEMMLAISFVEGNFCQHNYHFNCSGIGGNNIVKYRNFSQWVKSFDSLLDRRYKGFSVEEFKGVYVQPGSQNWIDGVKQILAELKSEGIN